MREISEVRGIELNYGIKDDDITDDSLEIKDIIANVDIMVKLKIEGAQSKESASFRINSAKFNLNSETKQFELGEDFNIFEWNY